MTSSPRIHSDAGAAVAVSAGTRALRHANVSTTPETNSSGTATRSARPTRRGPPATIAVATNPSPTAQTRTLDGPPQSDAQIDAAITSLRAIHAKLVMTSSHASALAPENPSGARHAMIEGTRSRGPSGASAATSAAPATAPAAMIAIAVRSPNDPANVAPTCSVVATMFAPAKTRKRSDALCV